MLLCSSASESSNDAQSLFWKTAPPAGRVRLRSWLWSACTFCTCLVEAHLRTSSRATSGKGCEMESESPSAYCVGTSCTGERPPTPNLWYYDQNHLSGSKRSLDICRETVRIRRHLELYFGCALWIKLKSLNHQVKKNVLFNYFFQKLKLVMT